MIIIRDGIYTENVMINKTLTVQSENGYSTTAVVSVSGLTAIVAFADNLTIEGLTVYGVTGGGNYGLVVNGDNCAVRNNRCGYDATHRNDNGLRIDQCNNVIVSGNICNSNVGYGLTADQSSNVTISSNTCQQNQGGMLIDAMSSSSVTNNTFSDNTLLGIFGSDLTNVTFRGNLITNNGGYGFYIYALPVPDLGSNSLLDKGRNTLQGNGYDVYNETAGTVNAYYNYWGVTSTAEIEANIYDDTDNASMGAVYFDPWLTEDQSLPVELSLFSACTEEDWVVLKWTTESETDLIGFIIERMEKNGTEWKTIASYQYHEALRGRGNKSCRTEYSFSDMNASIAKVYCYRLSEKDVTGRITVLSTVESSPPSTAPEKTRLEPVFPNPFNPRTEIFYQIAEETLVRLDVVDILGKRVRTLQEGKRQRRGSYRLFWNGRDDVGRSVASGSYILIMTTEHSKSSQKMFFMK